MLARADDGFLKGFSFNFKSEMSKLNAVQFYKQHSTRKL